MNTLYEVDQTITAQSQIYFLYDKLSSCLSGQGCSNGVIKFLYRLQFHEGAVVYVGTGLCSRMERRLSGKVLDYDNSDLVKYTEAAFNKGPVRSLHCVGLFQAASGSDVGADYERFEKCRADDEGCVLLNRNDLYRPIEDTELIASSDWLGDQGIRQFNQLASMQ
jgi:hypothetical protein